MLEVGDYVMINKKVYIIGHYHPELNNLFNRATRIIEVGEYENGVVYYKLDITKHCSFPFAFGESNLINIKSEGGV